MLNVSTVLVVNVLLLGCSSDAGLYIRSVRELGPSGLSTPRTHSVESSFFWASLDRE